MAAIEDRPLQPPLNEVEEDRAFLLHTHQNWRRSQQAGIRKKRQSEDEQEKICMNKMEDMKMGGDEKN